MISQRIAGTNTLKPNDQSGDLYRIQQAWCQGIPFPGVLVNMSGINMPIPSHPHESVFHQLRSLRASFPGNLPRDYAMDLQTQRIGKSSRKISSCIYNHPVIHTLDHRKTFKSHSTKKEAHNL